MISNIIGVSRPAFIVDFKEDPSGVYYGPRIEGTDEETEDEQKQIAKTTAEAISASMTGKVVIRFSEPLKASQDLKNLNQPQIGKSDDRCKVFVAVVEG